MWIVGVNRPYYPSVEIIETENDAEKLYQKLLEECRDENGNFESYVFKAILEKKEDILTDY